MWPQHSAIASYFAQIPDSTAQLLCGFTWLIHCFLDPPAVKAWEITLDITKGSLFMDTLLFPPLCPLCRHTHGCGQDIALVSTSYAEPSVYSLVHWAWNFLLHADQSWLCHISTTSNHSTGRAPHSTPPCLEMALHAYAQLRMMVSF